MAILIFNELQKIFMKKRIFLVVILFLIFAGFSIYKESRSARDEKDMDPINQQRMIQQAQEDLWNLEKQLEDPQLDEDERSRIETTVTTLKSKAEMGQYIRKVKQLGSEQPDSAAKNALAKEYLDKKGISTEAPYDLNSFTMLARVIRQMSMYFIPLLVVFLGSDIVSGEYHPSTMKLILTRPVPKWKLLLSKYAALVASITALILLGFLSVFIFSGLVYGWGRGDYPVVVGARYLFDGGKVPIFDNGSIHIVQRWLYTIVLVSLTAASSIVTSTITYSISLLSRKSFFSFILSVACIGGACLLSQMFNVDSVFALYNFATFLYPAPIWMGDLVARVVNGSVTGDFAAAVMAFWSIPILIIACTVFYKRDIYA